MSDPDSRTGTPRSFTSQAASAEDLLKSQTVGLVNLSDFRKRRAEVLEQKIKEAQNATVGRFKSSTSGSATPAEAASSEDGLGFLFSHCLCGRANLQSTVLQPPLT